MTTTADPTATRAAATPTRPPSRGGGIQTAPLARTGAATPRTRGETLALAGLLVATAALYLWDLSSSGWANAFYSAAVQAGSQSWTAFFYGASDAAASITVDKPPASLWVMALSVRAFGLSSWSILVPQALMGVGSVALLYASVRRCCGPKAGILAGAALALTPVAALMFRFNNPDALLVLLMVGGAYATLRAIEHARTRWLLLAAGLIGLAFLTKQLQAFLVLPGFVLAYAVAAPTTVGRRVRDLLGALAVMAVAAGWWVAIVELVPESLRPYIGGSQTNSFFELTFGYNGLGRITGDEVGSVGGGQWGTAGLGRLFSAEIGGQVAWLLPAALVLGAAAFWLRRRAPRTDLLRAALIVWGGWLLVTAITFSMMGGIFHEYYTVALAPAIAALVGIGAVVLWRARGSVVASGTLGGVVALTAMWSFVLLGRSPDFMPWLRWLVLAGGLAAAVLIAFAPSAGTGRRAAWRAGVALAVVAALAGPTAYTLDTVTTAQTGSIVTAGPTVAGASGPGGRGGAPGGTPQAGAAAPGTAANPGAAQGTTAPGRPGGAPGLGGAPAGRPDGTGTPGGTTGTGTPGGAAGGLLDAVTPSAALVDLLTADADSFTWAAATVGAQNAAGYQLATELPIMPIGGFNGSDPSPTLAQFQALVDSGEIHYYLAGGVGGPGAQNGGSQASSEIAQWVEATFSATAVDGGTVYDLTAR